MIGHFDRLSANGVRMGCKRGAKMALGAVQSGLVLSLDRHQKVAADAYAQGAYAL